MKTSKKPVVIGQFTGKCCDSNVVNNNDMHLGRELFENLIASDEYKSAMENRHYIGYLGHPEDPNCMDFKDACIVMTDMRIANNGEIEGTFDLIDTPVGRVVKSFIDAGVNFGISIRGAGDVDGQGEVDPETFVFRGFDLVTFPAYNDCIPEFQEIAASSDLNKQVKCKKVYSTLSDNLDKITSASTLNVLKEQFNPKSKEYAKLEAREKAIEASTDDKELNAVLAQKLEGMTQLYIKKSAEVSALKKKIAACQMAAFNAKKSKDRFIQSAKQKYNAQLVTMQTDIDDLEDELDAEVREKEEAIEAASRLRSQLHSLNSKLSSLESANLKYKQKVESSTNVIGDRNAKISELKGELDKTVVEASKTLKKETSNRDAQISSLESKLKATEQLVMNYQQAYADIYASALGVSLKNLSITSTTSVEDLQKVITASASLPVKPDMYEAYEDIDDTEDELIDDVIVDTGDAGIATL